MAAVEHHADIRHAGFVHDASKEYAEARMTLAFVRGDPLPAAEELVGVEVQSYLNGMAEAASELRRYVLDRSAGAAPSGARSCSATWTRSTRCSSPSTSPTP